MPKKSFKGNPALAFISTQEDAQEATREVAHEVTMPSNSGHSTTSTAIPISYVKTQGRKGHHKPRINLAFDSDAFLDTVRERAAQEGKSITQFVNDAVSYYLEIK
jgi:hypothetical protein